MNHNLDDCFCNVKKPLSAQFPGRMLQDYRSGIYRPNFKGTHSHTWPHYVGLTLSGCYSVWDHQLSIQHALLCRTRLQSGGFQTKLSLWNQFRTQPLARSQSWNLESSWRIDPILFPSCRLYEGHAFDLWQTLSKLAFYLCCTLMKSLKFCETLVLCHKCCLIKVDKQPPGAAGVFVRSALALSWKIIWLSST